MFLYPAIREEPGIIQRVRAILLTQQDTVMFIKRVKPGAEPYWVAPGGGVEAGDATMRDTLLRELSEELGASVQVLRHAFVLEHEKAGKQLEEHFFICRLLSYDLARRSGPEFSDPTRGLYLPHEIPLEAAALRELNVRTPELIDWLVAHLELLRTLARQAA